MTIFGIAGSMALMLVGFGIQDSIMDIATLQYSQLQHYDGTIIGDDDATEEEKEELAEYLAGNDKILRCTDILLTKMTAPRAKSSLSVYVYVPQNLEYFSEDVTLQDRKTKETYELNDDGAVICEKTASLLGLKAGDELTLKKDNKDYQVKVAAITENYMSHYVYMTPSVYKATFGEEPDYGNTVFTMKEEYQDDLEEIGNEILNHSAALSISYTSSIAGQLNRMLSSLGSVIVVLIISAGMLAFVVLYNLNNINITERQRELATLKVLGFYDGEVSQYVFRENILLTVIGVAVGALFGILLHRFVITTVEVDAVMFGRNIKLPSFFYSGVITVGFSMFVNMTMHFKLKKIDMVESLKSVE
jgi:putative ABC transport system permease protein